ncbi:MAG: YhgE/Pip domain-containing protein [Bacillaceae bacterium]
MSSSKNKILMLVPIVALLITFIFSVVQIPTAKQAPKNVPIAIVNEDVGVDVPTKGKVNFGETIVDLMNKTAKEATGEAEPAVKWIAVSDFQKAKKGMDNQDYYGALVIPKDYSLKQASLQTPTPSSPEINIYVNQGKNAVASNAVTQILNGIVDNMNKNVSNQLVEGLKKQDGKLTIQQASVLASPITKNVHYLNPTGTKGNAPLALFQPIWIGSLVAAVLLWLSQRKGDQPSKKKKVLTISMQIVVGAIASLVIGFGLTWMADSMLDFDIANFMDTALFLSITSFSFILMILAVLMWIGLAGMPIFILLLFFGAPLLAMAPEFMPSFYQDWIFSWLPMRFMIDGLRELFFFTKELSWNQPTSILVWIGLGSLIVLFLSTFKPNVNKKMENNNQIANR